MPNSTADISKSDAVRWVVWLYRLVAVCFGVFVGILYIFGQVQISPDEQSLVVDTAHDRRVGAATLAIAFATTLLLIAPVELVRRYSGSERGRWICAGLLWLVANVYLFHGEWLDVANMVGAFPLIVTGVATLGSVVIAVVPMKPRRGTSDRSEAATGE